MRKTYNSSDDPLFRPAEHFWNYKNRRYTMAMRDTAAVSLALEFAIKLVNCELISNGMVFISEY